MQVAQTLGRLTLDRLMLDRLIGATDCCPWGTVAGRRHQVCANGQLPLRRAPLYTPEQRRRRDASPWTLVQGILAPLQFLVFLLSLGFVLRTLLTGEGATAASASVVIKTGVLYTIMVTGAIWERRVFGRYLFADAFFWEDAMSMVVVGFHTAYLAAFYTRTLDAHGLALLALCAYVAYVGNATQFVMKLRAARLDERRLAAWRGPFAIDASYATGHAD